MMKDKDCLFNRERIEEELKTLQSSFYGYQTPVSAYVREKGGDMTDEKIEYFADELISIMRDNELRYKYYGMDGAVRRFLRLYIYLVLRAYNPETQGFGPITFGDLTEILKGMAESHDSLEELILCETGWQPQAEEEDVEDDYGAYTRYPRSAGGFFADLDRSYEMLAGYSIGEEMTEEQLQEIWERNETRKRQAQEAEAGRKEQLKPYEDQALEALFPGDPDYNFDLEASYGLDPEEYESQPYLPEEVRESGSEEGGFEQMGLGGSGLEEGGFEQMGLGGNGLEEGGFEPTDLEGSGLEEDAFELEDSEWADPEQEMDEDDLMVLYLKTWEKRDQKEEKRRRKEQKWKNSFRDPDKFLNAYQEFRSLFFQMDLAFLQKALETSTIVFLCREGKSGLADNDVFLRLYIQLEKTCRLARQCWESLRGKKRPLWE